MPFMTRKSLLGLGLLAGAGLVVAGGFVWSGIYNIGADDTHTKPVHALLQALREQSINQRAKSIEVPNLTDPALIRQGAGNYNAMCVACHLAPGIKETELSKGLYPSPPALTRAEVSDPAHHFWVIKHGIKASGMPAWGKSMQDKYIWGMVAFLQQLPKLDEAQYEAMVASSGGHSHGGGESGEHHDDEADTGDHDMAHMQMGAGQTAMHAGGSAIAGEGTTHLHADGKAHVHAAPQPGAKPAAKPAAVAAPTATTTPATEKEPHDHQH